MFALVNQLWAKIESLSLAEEIVDDEWPSIGIVRQKMGYLNEQFNTTVGHNICYLVNKATE